MLHAYVPMPVHPEARNALIVYTILMCVTTGGIFLWWAASARRRRDPALVLLLMGGALSGLLEPFLDNVVLFWYPPHQTLPTFHAFGRSVPMFVPIGYAWFCGALLYLVARIYERGVSRAQIWGIFGGVFVIDYLAIALTAWIHVAGFYGHPPLDVGGYPLWWVAFDGTDVVLGGAIVFYLLPRLRGAGTAWLILVPPVALGAATGVVGGPITTALNSQWSAGAKLVCAVATLGLAAAVVHAVSHVVTSFPNAPGLAPRGLPDGESTERRDRINAPKAM